MKIPDGFDIVYQPNYRTPSVFDLNQRGAFKTQPFVTEDIVWRVIADENQKSRIELLRLVEKKTQDPDTKINYEYAVEKIQIDLDEALSLIPDDLSAQISDPEQLEVVKSSFEEWRSNFVPVDDAGKTDSDALLKKIQAAVEDNKNRIREELVRRNIDWIQAVMPWQIQAFQLGLYRLVQDSLYRQYQENGGTGSEAELIRKIMQFQLVHGSEDQEALRKPEGLTWQADDTAWECWIGLAGSDQEARRVCDTMESVFRPLENHFDDRETA